MNHPAIDRRTEKLADLAQRIAAAKEGLRIASEIHQVTGLAAWSTVDKKMEEGIQSRLLQLASPATTERQSDVLRGEIRALRQVQTLPRDVMQDLAGFAAEIEGLQKRVAKWHNRTNMRIGQDAQPQPTSSKE